MSMNVVSAWLSGLRGRGFRIVFVLGVLLIGVAYLASMFSPRQPKTVALDVGFSCLRFTLVLLSLSWIQELVEKEIERRTVIFSLAYPFPRAHYLLGRYCGILGLVLVAGLILGLLLWFAVLTAGDDYKQSIPVALGVPFWVTLIGIIVDAIVVAAFALFVAALSTVPMLTMALGAIFAIAARGLGGAIDYVLVRGAGDDPEFVSAYGPALRMVRWLVPDLSRLDLRDWSLYGQGPEFFSLGYAFLMAVAYAMIFLGLAVVAFDRREFA